MYLAVTGVPFLSTRLTVTPVPLPVNDFSGTNVTVPSGATVYVPSPGIILVFDPSSNVAGVSSSISTVFSTPSTVALPPRMLVYLFVFYLEHLLLLRLELLVLQVRFLVCKLLIL